MKLLTCGSDDIIKNVENEVENTVKKSENKSENIRADSSTG